MLFEPLPAGPWPEPTTAALMLPFGQGGQGGPPSADTAAEGEVAPRGVLIAGLSPRIPMTDAYRNFFEVVTGQLTTAIANAWADQVTAKQRLDELTSELQEQLDAHVQLNAELREIGVEWERMLAEARAAARMRDEFLSAAAHDLRTPLTSIHGHAQLLQRQAARPGGVPADRLLSGIGQIQNAVAQMQRLVNDVVDVGRLQAGQSLSLDRQPADLVQLTQRAAQKHQQTTARHQIIVEAPALSLVGAWDARRLERVLDNLLSNALKYSPDGGPVTLFVTLTPPQPHEDIRWAALRVRDTGIGIPAAELAGIFDHFSHASNVQDQIRGSGIGLASVRQIVEQHGGAVSVESEEGKGSTFTVRLPL